MEFIQGNLFQELVETNPITNNGFELKYAHTHDANNLFHNINNDSNKCYVVILHNSDGSLTYNPTREYDANLSHLPKNIVKLYSQNVLDYHINVQSIPIGLERDMWFKDICKIDKIKDTREKILKDKPNRPNLLYMNFSYHTNPKERIPVYEHFKNKLWVTNDCHPNGYDYTNYLNNLSTHKFCLCPQGNGLQCHRRYESMYLRCIPIIKYNLDIQYYINNYFGVNLPILVVESWDQVTEYYLEQVYSKFVYMQELLNTDVYLDFNFWKQRILNTY